MKSSVKRRVASPHVASQEDDMMIADPSGTCLVFVPHRPSCYVTHCLYTRTRLMACLHKLTNSFLCAPALGAYNVLKTGPWQLCPAVSVVCRLSFSISREVRLKPCLLVNTERYSDARLVQTRDRISFLFYIWKNKINITPSPSCGEKIKILYLP